MFIPLLYVHIYSLAVIFIYISILKGSPGGANRAAGVRVGKGDKPVTCGEAHVQHFIAHRKGWLSLHTVNQQGREMTFSPSCKDPQSFEIILLKLSSIGLKVS
ncbi:unnamed protein product [Nyctereutes procyonoides]|uniref:(raccoon dog) hypothetical protein n=1 Tax=Nyctereutes procyonoides TaxID=34880 RepID=A0A811YSW1_NYCPR|nr:unnamed protein product [Nyctereutes procyonoides]